MTLHHWISMERIYVAHEDKIAALQRRAYFDGLSDAILSEIAEGMRLCRFEAGEPLFWDQEPCAGLHMIRKGHVKLFKVSPQGREFVLQTLSEGTTFNEASVFDGGENPVNAAAVEESEIWIIEPDAIRAGIEVHPELACAVVRHLTQNMRMLIAKVEELSFFQVTHRLARLIEQLPPERLAGKASTRLTHDQLAAQLGTVREVVGRSLRELERSGAIKVSHGRINVVNTDILQYWTQNPYQ
jgi:CRP-like cAMP-binding protein